MANNYKAQTCIGITKFCWVFLWECHSSPFTCELLIEAQYDTRSVCIVPHRKWLCTFRVGVWSESFCASVVKISRLNFLRQQVNTKIVTQIFHVLRKENGPKLSRSTPNVLSYDHLTHWLPDTLMPNEWSCCWNASWISCFQPTAPNDHSVCQFKAWFVNLFPLYVSVPEWKGWNHRSLTSLFPDQHTTSLIHPTSSWQSFNNVSRCVHFTVTVPRSEWRKFYLERDKNTHRT